MFLLARDGVCVCVCVCFIACVFEFVHAGLCAFVFCRAKWDAVRVGKLGSDASRCVRGEDI